jgi:predicted pyridoxine 5'-phosphate oxidase superfamily flavin-nucleotide-binding protein
MGGPVAQPVVDKTLSSLDRHCLTFIARSPFVLIASSNADGRMDISPKGDAPGFVKVLDENVIPDRPGNQRFDTLRNLFESPRISVISRGIRRIASIERLDRLDHEHVYGPQSPDAGPGRRKPRLQTVAAVMIQILDIGV